MLGRQCIYKLILGGLCVLFFGSCKPKILTPIAVDPGSDSASIIAGVPGAPTLVSVVSNSEGDVTLSWTAPIDPGTHPISNYLVRYSNNSGGTWMNYPKAVSADTVTLITGLNLGFPHVFQVAAVSEAGASNYSESSATITPRGAFISTWKTDNTSDGSSGADQIRLPLESNGTYNFTVDWGDGSTDTITTWDDPKTTHTYAQAGTYTVSIQGEFTGFQFNYGGDRLKLTNISQFGSLRLGNTGYFFGGAENLTITATDPLDLSGTTKLTEAFGNCRSLTTAPSMRNWDVSNITDMSWMFSGAIAFNQDIPSWNTSNVTTMEGMFNSAGAFNQNIGSWNMANVTNVSRMFEAASSFNQPIGSWNTSNVTTMDRMFSYASSFNQEIGSWSTAKVTNMNGTFRAAALFNQSLEMWNTANVTNMSEMFSFNHSFNGNIRNWNTSNVEDMTWMFADASAFNQDISQWNTSNVIRMGSMFARFSQTGTVFNQPIGFWNTAKVTEMNGMFFGASSFNQDIGNWNTANVTTMEGMFFGASAFNQDIGNWNTTSVITMNEMFKDASAFNQDISAWNTANVIVMSGMFQGASSFNQPIGMWNTAKATQMAYMFNEASVFNQNLANWNVTNVSTDGTLDMNSMIGMFTSSGLNQSNYDALLIGWSAKNVKWNIKLDMGDIQYTASSEVIASRNRLINEKGWVITDGGPSLDSNGNGWFLLDGVLTYYHNGAIANGFVDGDCYINGLNGYLTSGTGYCSVTGLYYKSGTPTDLDPTGSGSWNGKVYFLGQVATVMTWKTDNSIIGSSGPNQIMLPLISTGNYNFSVDWGDGSSSGIMNWDSPDKTHTYQNPGTYTLKIVGTYEGFLMWNSNDRLKLINISQFGSMRLGNGGYYFAGAENLTITATDPLDLTGTTNLNEAFFLCTSLTTIPSMNQWDVSQVTQMTFVFDGASQFNQDISNWDVSNATDMTGMFWGASQFNQDIGNWNTEKVTSMGSMFYGATSFNQNLGSWRVENVTGMFNMFASSGLTRNNYDGILLGWSAQNVMSGVELTNVSAGYSLISSVIAARTSLVTQGWTITDGGGQADSCSGDCYDGAQSLAIDTLREGPNGSILTLQYANGTSGFKIWKEKDGNRILNATGLVANGWQKSLIRAGTGFSSTDFTTSFQIAGRVCPPNVFLSHDMMKAENRCLYFDHGASSQYIGSFEGEAGTDWLGRWDEVNTGRGIAASYFEGNVKVCADKGMRLPTMYETTMNKPSSNLPSGDGLDPEPLWATTNGIPEAGIEYHLTASAYIHTDSYWQWSGSANYANSYPYAVGIRCVLPSYDGISPTAPGAPENLSGTPGDSQVSLSWSPPSDDGGIAITDYLIQVSMDGGIHWTLFGEGPSTNTTATVTGLTNGVSYIFKVAATNSIGTGDYGSQSSSIAPVSACSGDCFTNAHTLDIGTERQGPSGSILTLQYANGTSGYKIWKEKNGNRILNASGLVANGWQKTLNRSGTAFDTDLTNSTIISQIEGRVCPTHVFLDHNNMTATGRCLYYDAGNAAQSLSAASASGTEAEDWLQAWDRPITGRGASSSYYEGNIKTCADKGMRLPTMYETTMNKPDDYLPTGDIGVNPSWAGSANGVPSSGWNWTASASSNYTHGSGYVWVYWAWEGTNKTDGYGGIVTGNSFYNSISVRCVLP